MAGSQPESDGRIGLVEAIRSLRSELIQAMAEGEGSRLQFRVDPVELEFSVAMTKEASGQAGVKFWVVSAGAKGTVGSESSHRIKLTLHPVEESGTPLEPAEAPLD